jgi:hypothetical protein
MKSKRLLQILVLLALLFSPMGNIQPASAGANARADLEVPRDAMVINRNLNFWDATYVGFVSDSLHEKWRFEFTESHAFIVNASPITGGLVPLLSLLDASDNVLASGSGSLTSTQGAGTYYIMVQPESGSGFYFLTIRETVSTEPNASTSVNTPQVNVGETALVTVSLNNVPAEGYTSAEFTCTYDPAFVSTSNIIVGSLFGPDPASAINDPQNGTFIVAIAGSGENRATTSGPVFTFNVTALLAGATSIECTVRVSMGDNALTDLPSTGTSLTITGGAPTATATGSPAPSATPTSGETATPEFTSTPESSPTPTFTFTPLPTDTPTPTATPEPVGALTGQVLAGKPVTVSLYDASDTLVATVSANDDGTFNLTAPAGTYTVVATADGYLSAAGSVTLTSGGTSSMPIVTLLAGDLDGDDDIDEFDAMTIGMNYNGNEPATADLNNDGVINVLDLEVLAANYRATGPTPWE